MDKRSILQGTYCMPLIVNNYVKLCLNVLNGCVFIALMCLVQFTANKFGILILHLRLLCCNILVSLSVDAKLGNFLVSAFRSFVTITRNLMSQAYDHSNDTFKSFFFFLWHRSQLNGHFSRQTKVLCYGAQEDMFFTRKRQKSNELIGTEQFVVQ